MTLLHNSFLFIQKLELKKYRQTTLITDSNTENILYNINAVHSSPNILLLKNYPIYVHLRHIEQINNDLMLVKFNNLFKTTFLFG